MICYFLLKTIKKSWSGILNLKSLSRTIAAILLLTPILYYSSSVIYDSRPVIDSKNFSIPSNTKELSILNNSFCKAKYSVIIEKSENDSIKIYGENNKIKGLTLNSPESGKLTLTNIYPLQTCLNTEKPVVTVHIQSSVNLEINAIYLEESKDFTMVVAGFSKDKFKTNQSENTIFVSVK